MCSKPILTHLIDYCSIASTMRCHTTDRTVYSSHSVVLVDFVASATFAGTMFSLVSDPAAACVATAAIVFDSV